MFDTIGQKLRDLMILLRVYACVHHQLVSRIHLSLIDNENRERRQFFCFRRNSSPFKINLCPLSSSNSNYCYTRIFHCRVIFYRNSVRRISKIRCNYNGSKGSTIPLFQSSSDIPSFRSKIYGNKNFTNI